MAVRVWDAGSVAATDGLWLTATNWSGDAVPTTSDDVVFNSGSADVTTGPSLLTYASLTFTNDYTGTLGTELSFIVVNSTLLSIGGGGGAGSRRLNINLGTVTSTVSITGTASTGADTNRAPVRLICNSTSTDIYISDSSSTVDIIDEPTDTGNIGDINISGGTVLIGSGITAYTSLYVTGSSTNVIVEEPTAAQTITMDDGTVTVNGSNAVAGAVVRDGTYISNTTGTTTLITHQGGTVDFTQSQQARTVTTYTVSPLNTELKHLRGVVTFTNGIGLDTSYKDYNIKFSES